MKNEIEINEQENSIYIGHKSSYDEVKVFPEKKIFIIETQYDDDHVRYYKTYEYKIETEPTKMQIRLIEDCSTPPDDYSVRDGVVLESEMKGEFTGASPEDFKKATEWNYVEILHVSYFYILSKHPEILPEIEFRKLLRQTSENIHAALTKVEDAVNDNNLGLEIITDEDGYKSIFYPETETLIKEWDEYRDLMIAGDEKKEKTTYAKKERDSKKFTDRLFSVESANYVGIDKDTFERSSEIIQHINDFLERSSSLFANEESQQSSESSNEKSSSATEKTATGARIFFGLLAGLFAFGILFQIFVAIVALVGALALGSIGVNVSESDEALRNLEATANILSVIISFVLARKLYKLITS